MSTDHSARIPGTTGHPRPTTILAQGWGQIGPQWLRSRATVLHGSVGLTSLSIAGHHTGLS